MLITIHGCIMINKKGFISISVIYALFLVFCLLLVLIMSNYINNRINNKILKNDIKNSYYSALNGSDIDGICMFKHKEIEVPIINSVDVLCDNKNNVKTATEMILKNEYSKERSSNPLLEDTDDIETIKNYFKSKDSNNNESGMFVAEDDFGDSYYYKGNIENNFLRMGKVRGSNDTYLYWKILRINGDSSIRLFYVGTKTENNSKINYVTKSSIYSNENNQNVNYENSTLKNNIDSFYESFFESLSENIIVDSIFCNDKEIVFEQNNKIYYAAYKRFKNIYNIITPTLKCNSKEDRFTVNGAFGNGKLKYPIATITVDELYLAYVYYEKYTDRYNNNFLFNYIPQRKLTQNVITMTPGNNTSMFGIKYDSYNNNLSTINTYACYDDDTSYYYLPVVSISACNTLIGNGTVESPYVVEDKGD